MKNNGYPSILLAGLVFALVVLAGAVQGFASMKELKAYKEAFPKAKAKCATCHIAAMPKENALELNAYGKAAMSATPNAETFKKLGKAEDFKK